MDDLHRCLVDSDMARLRALAQARGVPLSTNRQVEAVDQLTAALLDPFSVRLALDRLSSQARDALDALLLAGGRMRAPQFTRRFGHVRPMGPGRLEREAPWLDPVSPAEELWYAALVFRGFAEDVGGPGEFVFVPNDLQPLLPQPETTPPAFAVEIVPPPPPAKGDTQSLVRDMFAYLVFLQNHTVQPYADGRLGRRDLAALRKLLTGADDRRLRFLRHLASRLQFTARQGAFLHLQTNPVKRWLTSSANGQLLALQEAWRDDPTWNDLCHVPGLICDPEGGWRDRYDPVAMRQALLALLARCPLEGWWSVDSFVAAVKEFHPDFQRPDGDYASWYIRDATSGTYLSGFASWDAVEGVLIADLLGGPLHWLDVVDVATGESGVICSLTEAGARFLGRVPHEVEALPSPPITISPEFYVELPAPVSLYVRFQLERFADLVREDPPCRYRLTADGLGRALSQNVRVEQVLAFLQQASGRPVPPNVAAQFRMWAGRFGQVELEEVVLLRTKQEAGLKELSVLPETRALIAEVLSPTTALVRKHHLPRLRKVLRELGYLLPSAGGSADDPIEPG